jgi:tRNA G18 (ribose-2'-O)-methylase SpoU
VFVADQPTMNQIVGFNMHRGVLAIGIRGPSLTLPELLARGGPVVVLEDLTNHDNLGGVFRNAAALGGMGVSVLLSPRCADPLYRKSIRVSMGAAMCVPFVRATAWPDVLKEIVTAGYEVWGMTPGADTVELGEACRGICGDPGRVAVLLGSEGPGLTAEALAACTKRVRIVMRKADPTIDSLNVAMASGIVLHCLGDIARTNV